MEDIFFENGLISVMRSDTYFRFDKFDSSAEFLNISLENCMDCINGVLGFLNIYNVTITNFYINGSKSINGGVLSMIFGSSLNLVNFKAINSEASQIGGVLYLIGCKSVLIRDQFLLNARASKGGAYHMKTIANFTIINQTCVNVSSKLDGGVIYAIDSKVDIVGGLFNQVHSFKDGGAVFLDKGTFTSSNGFMASELSAQSGGFLFGNDLDLIQLIDFSIKNCSASITGLALYLDDCKAIEFLSVVFIDIYSEGYGSIYFILRNHAFNYRIHRVHAQRIVALDSNFIYLVSLLSLQSAFYFEIVNVTFTESIGSLLKVNFQGFCSNQRFKISNLSLNAGFEALLNSSWNNDNIFSIEKAFMEISSFYLFSVYFLKSAFYCLQGQVLFKDIIFSLNKTWNIALKSIHIFVIEETAASIENINFQGQPKQNLGLVLSVSANISLINLKINHCQIYSDSCIKAIRSKLFVNKSHFKENFGLNSGVVYAVNSTLVFDSNIFESNIYLAVIFGFEYYLYKRLSNNILISGDLTYEGSFLYNNSFIENNLGASLALENTFLTILSTNFSCPSQSLEILNIKSVMGLNSDLKIFSCRFQNLSGAYGGSISLQNLGKNNIKRTLIIKDSFFENSKSYYGGAFANDGYSILILENNIFINCTAKKTASNKLGTFGVGVNLCIDCESGKFVLRGNSFINNSAEFIIPNIFSSIEFTTDDTGSVLESNYFLNNFDIYNFTDTICNFPIKVLVFLIDDQKQINIETEFIKITSGHPIKMVLSLTDSLGNIFIFDNDSTVELQEVFEAGRNLFMIKNHKTISKRGQFLLEDLTINTDPLRHFMLKIKFKINFEKLFPYYIEKLSSQNFTLKLISRECLPGELYIIGDQSCQKCPFGKFSFSDPMTIPYELQKCHICPQNAFCPGGDKIIPQQGFWRSSKTSVIMIECQSRVSCLGFGDGKLAESEMVHGKCMEKSRGPFCFDCDPEYARFSVRDACKPCSSEVFTYVKFSIVVSTLVLYLLVQIRLTFKFSHSSHAGILLKLLVSHLQQIGMVSLVNLGWTPDFKALFEFQQYLSFLTEDFLPIECLISTLGFNKLSQKIIVSNILPVLLSIFVFFSWLLFTLAYTYIRKSRFTLLQSSMQTFKVTSLIVIVLLFPELIRKCLSLFNCIDIKDEKGTRVLLHSPDIICWETDHIRFISYCAIPGLITWGVIAPIFITYQLKKNSMCIKNIIKSNKLKTHEPSGKKDEYIDFDSIHRADASMLIKPRKSRAKHSEDWLNVPSPLRTTQGPIQLKLEIKSSTVNLPYAFNQSKENNISEKDIYYQQALLLKFLYKGYSSKNYYWEGFLFFKKFILTCITSVSDLFPTNLRGMVLISFLSFFLIVQSRVQPYEIEELNNIEIFSLITTFLTANIGIMMFTVAFQRLAPFLFVVVIIFNISFFVFWTYLFSRELLGEFPFIKKLLQLFRFKRRVQIFPEINNRFYLKKKPQKKESLF